VTYIRHITLTTGHSRDSHREEVSEEALAVCRDLLARVAAGVIAESIPIPGLPTYYLQARSTGRCATLTVYAQGEHEPLLTIGIATHSRCGAILWRALHQFGSAPVVTDPTRCPPEPWVAVAIEQPATDPHHQEMLPVLADLERCLAWAFLEAQ
jgi:hypothetical protein